MRPTYLLAIAIIILSIANSIQDMRISRLRDRLNHTNELLLMVDEKVNLIYESQKANDTIYWRNFAYQDSVNDTVAYYIRTLDNRALKLYGNDTFLKRKIYQLYGNDTFLKNEITKLKNKHD